jgi:hypothetical protein
MPFPAIYEYRGTILTREIFPRNVEALHWLFPAALRFSGVRDQEGVFAKHASVHPTRIPEWSYLRAALAHRRREIVAAV